MLQRLITPQDEAQLPNRWTGFRQGFRWTLGLTLLAWGFMESATAATMVFQEESSLPPLPSFERLDELPTIPPVDDPETVPAPQATELQPIPEAPTETPPATPPQSTPVEPGEPAVIVPVEPAPPVETPVAEPAEDVVEAEAPPAPKWSMLITPGPSSDPSADTSAQLVQFELDAETGQPNGTVERHTVAWDTTDLAESTAVDADGVASVDSSIPAQFPAGLKATYQSIYDSIPFSRAEYLANPAYRHEATLELLFGQMRPTVIHKEDKPQRIYNLPPIHEGSRFREPTLPYGMYAPYYYGPRFYGPGFYGFPYRGYGWSPNSTYRRYPTTYGPLFHSYYRPLTRPYGY